MKSTLTPITLAALVGYGLCDSAEDRNNILKKGHEMITDTKAGQTNYCPNCEDQARRIEELERRQAQLRTELFSLASTVSEYLLFTAKSTDLSKAYHSAIEVINATPSHSAACEWNQHVEWMKTLPFVAYQYTDAAGSFISRAPADSLGASEAEVIVKKLVAIPELKEVKE